MSNRRANLFLVGAMRAGTTSLFELLSQHPRIFTSPVKEPNHFVSNLPNTLHKPTRFQNEARYFKKQFPRPLHITHIKHEKNYAQLFSMAMPQHQYLLEASTAYLHAPGTADRIKEYHPEASILIVLRDPIERAYSHYRMDVALGRTAVSFETIIQKELKQLEKGMLVWNSYIGMSRYKEAIRRYRTLFDTVHCLEFEKMVADPKQELDNLFEKLHLETFQEIDFKSTNVTESLRYTHGLYLLQKIGILGPLQFMVGSRTKHRMFEKLKRRPTPMMLSDTTLKALQKVLEDE